MESEEHYVLRRYKQNDNAVFGCKSNGEYKRELERLRNLDDEDAISKIANYNK